MKSPFLFAVAAAAMSVAGCSTMMPGADIADMTPVAAMPYVEMAGASDMFEIESSRLALTRSQDAQVRQFAQMMIDHHTQTTAQLTAAARTAGITPRPQLLPMHAEHMEALRAASGSAFDRLYIDQQVPAHEMALALHGNYANSGDNAALRTVAAAATPIVTQHLQRARQLDR